MHISVANTGLYIILCNEWLLLSVSTAARKRVAPEAHVVVDVWLLPLVVVRDDLSGKAVRRTAQWGMLLAPRKVSIDGGRIRRGGVTYPSPCCTTGSLMLVGGWPAPLELTDDGQVLLERLSILRAEHKLFVKVSDIDTNYRTSL